jgi:hypothetical protein
MVDHEKLEFRLLRILVASLVGVPLWALFTWLWLLCPQWVSYAALFSGLVLFYSFELGHKWVGAAGGVLMFSGVVSAALSGALKWLICR